MRLHEQQVQSIARSSSHAQTQAKASRNSRGTIYRGVNKHLHNRGGRSPAVLPTAGSRRLTARWCFMPSKVTCEASCKQTDPAPSPTGQSSQCGNAYCALKPLRLDRESATFLLCPTRIYPDTAALGEVGFTQAFPARREHDIPSFRKVPLVLIST